MPKISRTDPGAILSKAVEYHGFVYLQGVTAKDTSKNIRDRDGMNEVWTPWLPKNEAPARACVQAELANPSILVEIMVTACK
jgi:hypothetical protein